MTSARRERSYGIACASTDGGATADRRDVRGLLEARPSRCARHRPRRPRYRADRGRPSPVLRADGGGHCHGRPGQASASLTLGGHAQSTKNRDSDMSMNLTTVELESMSGGCWLGARRTLGFDEEHRFALLSHDVVTPFPGGRSAFGLPSSTRQLRAHRFDHIVLREHDFQSSTVTYGRRCGDWRPPEFGTVAAHENARGRPEPPAERTRCA